MSHYNTPKFEQNKGGENIFVKMEEMGGKANMIPVQTKVVLDANEGKWDIERLSQSGVSRSRNGEKSSWRNRHRLQYKTEIKR